LSEGVETLGMIVGRGIHVEGVEDDPFPQVVGRQVGRKRSLNVAHANESIENPQTG